MSGNESSEILNTIAFDRKRAIALLSGLSTAIAIFHAKKLEILWSNQSFRTQTLIRKTCQQNAQIRAKILVTDLFPKSDLNAVLELISIARESGASIDTERSIFKSNAEQFPAKIVFFRFDQENSDLLCFEFSDLSVTQLCRELSEKERRLRTTQDELLSTAKWASVGKLAGGIAHEINNPLSIIKGRVAQMLKLIEMKKIDSNTMNNLQSRIDAAISRISQLTYGLLTVSQMGIPQSQTIERADDLIAAAIEPFTERCAKLGLEINVTETKSFQVGEQSQKQVFETSHHVPMANKTCVLVNAMQIRKVLMCLIENSIDAIELSQSIERKTPPKITVEYCRNNDCVSFKVIDNGKGIPKEHAKDIFEPFFTTKPLGQGTGLSLSLALRIAESHGGALRNTSGSGHTEFVLELPLPEQSQQSLEKGSKQAS